MPNYNVLYNPHAGNGHGEENAKKLKEILRGNSVDFQDMTKIYDYAAFFAAFPKNGILVISGGDGTLNRFINDTQDIALPEDIFYYAGGSGNDFLRDVKDREAPPLIPLGKYLESLPQVVVNGFTYHFLNGIGYGIDGYCCEVGDKQRKTSTKSVNYTAIAIKGLLFHYKPTNAVIMVDGTEHSYKKVWLAPTMNGRYYGGGMMPTPNQNRLDPNKNVSTMVFHGSGKLKTLMIFPSIFQGKHIEHTKEVDILTGHTISVTFDRPTALQIDGETILGVTEYQVTTAKVPASV